MWRALPVVFFGLVVAVFLLVAASAQDVDVRVKTAVVEEAVAVEGVEVRAIVVEPEAERPPLIQLAILLDNSGSMRGLIDQARAQLWSVVNEFATVKRDGRRPELQVALYEYGSSPKMILPLTTDLDKVSQELFALGIRGGTERCGEVIQLATNGLAWSASHNDYKVIFIAGNEPFTQGSVDYKVACKAAISKGITVNTIHCGDYQTGVNTSWKDGAMLADGSYMHIDHNKKAIVHAVVAPQDVEIAKLGAELNTTYLSYGSRGREGAVNQSEQDSNASNVAPSVAVSRAVSKASHNYNNAGWDLVDAKGKKDFKLDEVKDEELPENMRKMNLEERKAFIEKNATKRAELQGKINTLNEARKKFVAEELKKRADKGEDTLEAVMIKSVRTQAEKKNFKFK